MEHTALSNPTISESDTKKTGLDKTSPKIIDTNRLIRQMQRSRKARYLRQNSAEFAEIDTAEYIAATSIPLSRLTAEHLLIIRQHITEQATTKVEPLASNEPPPVQQTIPNKFKN